MPWLKKDTWKGIATLSCSRNCAGTAELQLPVSQALALFVKLLRSNLQEIQKAGVSATVPEPAPMSQDGTSATVSLIANAERRLTNMEADLDAAGDEDTTALQEKQRAIIDSLDLSR